MNQTIIPPEDAGSSEVEVRSSDALEAIDRANVDIQISTAKRYPRELSKFKENLLTEATRDAETAAGMFYDLKRSGKKISGPSVRLAEVAASHWGNLRIETDIVGIDRTHVTAMGSAFDLEKNVAIRVRVKRRITDKEGRRYGDDLITVTSMAAASIALRNAILKVIPGSLTRDAYLAARTASTGVGTLPEKIGNAFEWYARKGVKEKEVLAYLELRSKDDVSEEHLIELRGLRTAIQEGTTSIEAAFRGGDTDESEAEETNRALQKEAKDPSGADGPPVPDPEFLPGENWESTDSELGSVSTGTAEEAERRRPKVLKTVNGKLTYEEWDSADETVRQEHTLATFEEVEEVSSVLENLGASAMDLIDEVRSVDARALQYAFELWQLPAPLLKMGRERISRKAKK